MSIFGRQRSLEMDYCSVKHDLACGNKVTCAWGARIVTGKDQSGTKIG